MIHHLIIQIWDTAGQEKYHSLAPLYYRGSIFCQSKEFKDIIDADAAILVYDVTSKRSLYSLEKWCDELRANGPENISKGLYIVINKGCIVSVIVGNKTDLYEKEEVKTEEGAQFAKVINFKNCLFITI